MDHAARSRDVDQPVQALPALAAEPSDHLVGGGEGQWDEQHETGEPHGDVRPLRDVVDDSGQREELVEHYIGQEVQTRIKEGE